MAEYMSPSAELSARVALEKHGFHHTHSLGQNFLLDERLLTHLLDASEEPDGAENVLEIGPGAGVMTRLLAGRARRVCALELDRSLEPVLRDVLSGLDNVDVIYEDAMKADLAAIVREQFSGEPWRVVANLPYYITADVILRLVTLSERPESISIMVQKEAAERIMAQPGTKQWCVLAATVQSYGEARVLMDIGPEAFDPPPHVMSRFICIRRYELPPFSPKDERIYLRLIHAAFAMRRKTLANNLKAGFGLDNEAARRVLADAGLDDRVRGEALTLTQLCRLADVLWERQRRADT